MDVDETLLKLGKYNGRRILTYCLICWSVTVVGCWHMMSFVFIGGEPTHHCAVPSGQTLNATIPLELKDKKWRYSQCSRYVNLTVSNETTSCDDGWYYDDSEFHSTIVSDWDLVCDKNYLAELSQSVFTFGVMVGAIIFTPLADRFGRKPIHLVCQYSMIVLGVVVAFAPNYITFVVFRFFLGAVREGAGLVGIVMACELFPAVYRTFAGTALELFWAAAWMFLALMAYLIRDWRHLQLAVTLPGVLTLALIWEQLLPESVPWLIANHKLEKAESIIRRVFKTYHARLPSSLSVRRQTLKAADIQAVAARATVRGRVRQSVSHAVARQPVTVPAEMRTQVTICDLLHSRKMVLYMVVMCSLWFANGVVYFGLSLSTSTLAGNKYINFFLSGAVEAPAYGLTVVVLQKCGRRWPLFIFHVVAGAALFIGIFVPQETEDGRDLTALIVTLSMTGKFAMTASFGAVVLYAQEIYPTNVRNLGIGISSCSARIGGTIAPFLVYIGKFASWIPGIVFTAVAFATALLALLLPETLNRPLPETVKEVESWTRSLTPAPAAPHHPPSAADIGHPPTIHEVDGDEKDIKSSEM